MNVRLLVLLTVPPLLFCDHVAEDALPLRREPADLAITDVAVIAMATEQVLEHQTVLVRAGRITAIAPAHELGAERGTPTIDGRGRFLLPGLIDMHVHINAADLPAYLQHGVTSVRNMWGYDQLAVLRDEIEQGRRAGPRIFSLTAGFDGSPATWPNTQLSDDVRTIAGNLDHQVALGFREIKVYQRLSLEAYDTIVSLARRRGLSFAGHLPTAVTLRHAIDAGQRSFEHLGGFRTSPDIAADARYAAARGVYVCPTLEVQSIGNQQRGDEQRRAWTAALYREGVKLLVGTDAGIDRTQPGSSMHDELRHFVEAGVTPYDALRGATTLAAEYLGQSGDIGRIAVGLEADLLLLRGNPLQDIMQTRQLEAVIVNGVRLR